MSRLNPNNTNISRRYKFVLLFFLAQFVFATMTMAQNQRIIVGVLENWPPQYMTDPKTKEPIGFAVDIIRETARLSGLDISYEVFKEWPVLNQALRDKKIDVIPNMGIIEEREELFKYTIPVETTKISFFVRKTSNDINSEKDLTGRAISVVDTNKGRFLMEERGWGNLKVYQSFDEALMSLLSGISDGFVYPDPPFMNILQQYGLSDRIKVVGEPLLEVKRAIAVHRDHSDLVNRLNDSVKALMSSAKYKEIYSRWYGKPAPFWSVKLVAVIMGISISIIGMALLAWRFYSVMKLNNSLLVQTQKRTIAEEALQTSREDLIESQRIAHVGSWRWDIKSDQVVWSEELYTMYGFDHALPPPTYTEHQKLFTPESWDRLSVALNNTRDKGIPYELELETVREDGSHGWMWVYGQTLLNTKGEIVGLRGAAQDITERKAAEAEQRRLFQQVERDRRALISTLEDQQRTEESLRESEERFRRAVTGAPFPIMIHAEDGQVVTINSPWTRLTGYEHSDIPTIADWTRKAYGTQMDLVQADIDGLYALDGPKAEGEYPITTSSGDSRIWDFSSAPIGQLPDGRRLVISMAMDVTKRKQLEAERQKFFLLAESSSEFIGMCDLDMNPLYVNPAGRRMVGLADMAAACRVKVQDYFFPEDQQFIAKEFFPRVLREGHGDVEIRLRHFQTGEPIWMFYYLFSVHDAGGTPIGWATVSRDITERRQAELSLRTYSERLKNLHRIDQAILQATKSPEKIAQEAILHVRDLLHCQRVSVGIFDFEKKEVRVYAATGEADSVVQTEQVVPEALYGELGILQQNGLEIIEDSLKMETVPAILRTIQAEGVRSSINAPIASPKGLTGVLSIGWDTPRTITPEEQEIVSEVASQIAIAIQQARLLQETKRHAEELEETVRLRTSQLEASNKDLEAFSYSVSHDLRAPLRHISGYVDLLNNRFRETLPEQAGHFLNVISDSASQMGCLIDDLLQFSRTGRQELRQADMDMNAIVQETLEKLKPDMKNRNISWTVADLPRVLGDYSLFKQVWMNLLANAVKYTRYKDEAEIEVGFTREPEHWEFFVRDNGVGFDMQYVHKLFGVFQRLHSTAQFEGTGIGLANVQRIVHKHGGRVRAEGWPEKGASFYFTIPEKPFDEEGIS